MTQWRPSRLLPFLVCAALANAVSAEQRVLILDSSVIQPGSYLEPFGSGNGVYIAAPDGTPPANNIPFYLWPSGVEESISANIQSVADAGAPAGVGAWQGLVQPANDGAVAILFQPSEIFGTGTYELRDLNEISWRTNKPDPQTNPDWLVTVWLDAGGGNVAILFGEPYWSNNLNAPSSTWNTWTADDTAGGTNEITFHEPGFACTNFGWSAPAGTMPTLAQLVAGPFTWNNVPSQNFLPGCAGTPNPLTFTTDYSQMPIFAIGIQTSNPWAGAFTGSVDDLRIALDDPAQAGTVNNLFVDFEPNVGTLSEATIDKAFSPAQVGLGQASTLTLTISNPNPQSLGGLTVTDSFPPGMQIASPSGFSDTCGFGASVSAGMTSIALEGGAVAGSGSCQVSVDVVTTGTGSFVNTTGPLTDATRQFPSAAGTDTATATLEVQGADLQITKTADAPSAVPGASIGYTVEVANAGPSAEPAATLTDMLAPELDCTWTSSAQGGATGNTASGSGDLSELLSLPVGGSVTYLLACNIDPVATGPLSNTATVTASIDDPIADNNSATATTALEPTADLQVTKTDGLLETDPLSPLTYTIGIVNIGPSTEPSALLTDTLPPALACSWTSSAQGGAAGQSATGTGDLAETLSLPPGSSVTYQLACSIDPTFAGTLSNTASATGSTTDPTPGNNSATDADTQVLPLASPIPMNKPAALALLAILLVLMAFPVLLGRAPPGPG